MNQWVKMDLSVCRPKAFEIFYHFHVMLQELSEAYLGHNQASIMKGFLRKCLKVFKFLRICLP